MIEPLAQGEISHPDLVLTVHRMRRAGGLQLHFQLHEANAELPFVQQLDCEPLDQLKDLFSQIEKIWVSAKHGEEGRRRETRRIEGFGATLAERLLPAKLRQRLHTHWDPERGSDQSAPTLLVISDEPWIPWELLRLRGPQGEVFLAEAFALSRWLWDLDRPLATPMCRIGVVISGESGLPEVAVERQEIHDLEQGGERQVEVVPAQLNAVLEGFSSDRFSAWHFGGHGCTARRNPDLSDLILDDGDRLKATDLRSSGCDLHGQRPLVFLNACRSARMELALSGLGGLAQAFLETGAGAVVGTHWSVTDAPARSFAREFYRCFLSGDPIAEAARQARLWLRSTYPGDPTWLAYTVFADPRAAVRGSARLAPALLRPLSGSEILRHGWRSDDSPLKPGGEPTTIRRVLYTPTVTVGDSNWLLNSFFLWDKMYLIAAPGFALRRKRLEKNLRDETDFLQNINCERSIPRAFRLYETLVEAVVRGELGKEPAVQALLAKRESVRVHSRKTNGLLFDCWDEYGVARRTGDGNFEVARFWGDLWIVVLALTLGQPDGIVPITDRPYTAELIRLCNHPAAWSKSAPGNRSMAGQMKSLFFHLGLPAPGLAERHVAVSDIKKWSAAKLELTALRHEYLRKIDCYVKELPLYIESHERIESLVMDLRSDIERQLRTEWTAGLRRAGLSLVPFGIIAMVPIVAFPELCDGIVAALASLGVVRLGHDLPPLAAPRNGLLLYEYRLLRKLQ